MRKGFMRNILVSLIPSVQFSEVKRQEVLSLKMMLISLKCRETLIPTTNPGDLFSLTPRMSRGTVTVAGSSDSATFLKNTQAVSFLLLIPLRNNSQPLFPVVVSPSHFDCLFLSLIHKIRREVLQMISCRIRSPELFFDVNNLIISWLRD